MTTLQTVSNVRNGQKMTFLPIFLVRTNNIRTVVAKMPSMVGHTVTEKLAILFSLSIHHMTYSILDCPIQS